MYVLCRWKTISDRKKEKLMKQHELALAEYNQKYQEFVSVRRPFAHFITLLIQFFIHDVRSSLVSNIFLCVDELHAIENYSIAAHLWMS